MADASILREYLVALGFQVDVAQYKKMENALGSIAKGVKTLGMAVVGTATALVTGTELVAVQMEKLYYASQRTGTTVKSLMSLRYAAGQIGLTAEQAQGALENFTRTLRLNPGTHGLLRSLGVTATDPAKMFEELISRLSTMAPFVAAKYAQIFGIDPDTLLMLEQGLPKLKAAQEKYAILLKKFGLSPDAAAAQSVEFANKIRDLQAEFSLLATSIGVKLMPVLLPMIERFEQWLMLHAEDIVKAIADGIESMARWLASVDWANVGKRIDGIVEALGGFKGILIGIAAISLSGIIGGVLSLAAAVIQLVGAGAALAAGGGAAAAGGAAGAAGGAVAGGAAAGGGGGLLARILGFGSKFLKGGVGAGLLFHSGELNANEDEEMRIRRSLIPEHLKDQQASLDSGVRPTPTPPASATPSPAGGATNAATKLAALEKKYGLPTGLLDRVWNAESGRGKHMLSPAGARGHFQFMPKTAKEFGLDDPDDFEKSADAAARKYAGLLKQYGGDIGLAAAAYNFGQGNLAKSAKRAGVGVSELPLGVLPKETQGYVGKTVGDNATSLTQNNTITITGVQQPEEASRMVADAMSVNSKDIVRQMTTRVQ